MLGAVKRFLPDEGLFDAALRGGRSLATKDVEGMTTLLIDAEMKMFARAAGRRSIFLQNIVVDLLLGLGFKDAFTDLRRPRARALRRRARIHHDEPADAARRPRRGRDREPDRLLEHQQDRLPHVRRHRGLRGRRCASAASGRSRCRSSPPGRSRRRRRSSGSAPSPTCDSIVFGASSCPQHPRHPRAGRPLLAALTTLLVASTGGHLKQLHQPAPIASTGISGPVLAGSPSTPRRAARCWRARRSTSSPSSAAATRATSPATSPTRGGSCAAREVDALVSTGSAVALPFFAHRAGAAACAATTSRAPPACEGPSTDRQADLADPRRPPLLPVPQLGRTGAGASAARSSTPSPAPTRRRLGRAAEITQGRRHPRHLPGTSASRAWSSACWSSFRPRPRSSGRPATPTSRELRDRGPSTRFPEKELTRGDGARPTLVVAHAGVGAALAAFEVGKCPVLVPAPA